MIGRPHTPRSNETVRIVRSSIHAQEELILECAIRICACLPLRGINKYKNVSFHQKMIKAEIVEMIQECYNMKVHTQFQKCNFGIKNIKNRNDTGMLLHKISCKNAKDTFIA